MRWDARTIAVAVPVAIVAGLAGVVSYGHIEALALSVHQTLAAARMLPFSVDGLIVAGSVMLLAGSWLGWLCVAPGIAATVYANVMSGVGHGPLAATVAAWPAAAFALASFTLERWLKRQVGRGGTGGQEVAQSPLAEPIGEPFPEPVPATPEPPRGDSPRCGHTVAGTPEENVVRQYLHERDCLGETPSQRRLAATHGLSRPKVAALVGTLNGGPHD